MPSLRQRNKRQKTKISINVGRAFRPAHVHFTRKSKTPNTMSVMPMREAHNQSGKLKSKTTTPMPTSKMPNNLHNSHFPVEFRTRNPPDAAIRMREAAATAFRYHDMRASGLLCQPSAVRRGKGDFAREERLFGASNVILPRAYQSAYQQQHWENRRHQQASLQP